MSYKVEELLALRDSVSESAVSLDRFADEDVIKEHVLRPSASASLAGASSDKTFRSSITPALAPAAPNKKPSPSPSIKRGKAERLLKEHGSPPGMRVTAGGRVVPIDLPPLSNNRSVNTSFKPPVLRGITPVNTMSAQPRPDVNNITRLEVVGSQPVLYVGDRAFALPALDANNIALPSLGPAVMDTAAKPAAQASLLTTQAGPSSASFGPPRSTTQTPFAGVDLPTLRTQQSLKKQELKSVEQTEVLQANHQSDAWRAGMIEKKRNLILEIDALRKQISALEAADNNVPPTQPNPYTATMGSAVPTAPPPPFVPQFQQPMPSPMYAFPGAGAYPPMMMYQPPFAGFPSVQATEPAPFVQNPIQAPQSPGSASRRSHAIEIKPPREENKKQISSALDPKSPTYEPVGKTTNTNNGVPPTPSPAKPSPWRAVESVSSEKQEGRAMSHKPSLSSIDTTDFFPTNTHEHSSTRVAPKVQESKQVSNESTAAPSTPEKNWPASPWNDGGSGRSSSKAVTKLTSWPEAFGKQPSLPSLRQTATVQPPANQERVPLQVADPIKSALTSNVKSRMTSEQGTGTDENWPFAGSKAINHVPSTYQEGYQAGYDHVGIPDSPDVIKGYIQGLLQFLTDEGKKARNNVGHNPSAVMADLRSSSLRGLVAGSTPHDSAVSMTFNRDDAPIGSHENDRSTKGNSVILDARRDSAFSQYGSGPDAPSTHSVYNEAAQGVRFRNQPTTMYLTPADVSDKIGSFYRRMPVAAVEDQGGNKNQDKGIMSRTDSAISSSDYPRQISGNQLSNRGYGTPVSMQRFYPTPKEYGQKGITSNVLPLARPLANQRLSGLDGAMDDLADLITDTHIDQPRPTTEFQRSITEGQHSSAAIGSTETVEGDASCFRSSSSKGKQKVASSPPKPTLGEQNETNASSPAHNPGSPKKSGEHSPAKARLEQVTNKFRRAKRDDPRNMSPDDKKRRSEKWHRRFRNIKEAEMREIHDHVRENPRR